MMMGDGEEFASTAENNRRELRPIDKAVFSLRACASLCVSVQKRFILLTLTDGNYSRQCGAIRAGNIDSAPIAPDARIIIPPTAGTSRRNLNRSPAGQRRLLSMIAARKRSIDYVLFTYSCPLRTIGVIRWMTRFAVDHKVSDSLSSFYVEWLWYNSGRSFHLKQNEMSRQCCCCSTSVVVMETH